jgi:hypothetical protein
MFRTDKNNNPAAFTTDVASQGGLEYGKDYTLGDSFPHPCEHIFTAKLLGDPVALTIKVIDKIGYYTKAGQQRWSYIAIPKAIWDVLTMAQKRDIVGFHYHNEGGTAMINLFPNYSKITR